MQYQICKLAQQMIEHEWMARGWNLEVLKSTSKFHGTEGFADRLRSAYFVLGELMRHF